MKELSLYILDIAQNSIKAGAKNISIKLEIDHKKDFMRLSIEDDGCGMDEELLEKAFDPFTTTRKERKVGLGLPFFRELAVQCGGDVKIRSQKGVGTCVEGTFKLSSIDLIPIGDMPSTIVSLIVSDSDADILFEIISDGRKFSFNTFDIKKLLNGVKITEPSVLQWLIEYLEENINCVMEV
ncbi:ATP-binding protein [Thermoanaerobacterium thermosulfurigenes]|uniref:ATP-binding protein n=1 Tax=Thermoanaerobacterium thermosulfurigenes TaxID=33950 RepID=UPI003EF1BC1C